MKDAMGEKEGLIKELNKKDMELQRAFEEIKLIKACLVKEDKMASIGQLSAGITHEINNPLGFVISNFGTLKKYVDKFKEVIYNYEEFKEKVILKDDGTFSQDIKLVNEFENKNKINFIIDDLNEIFKETEDGLDRVMKIVQSLRMFSHEDLNSIREVYDLNEGINNTLIITKNETKYTSEIEINLSQCPYITANSNEINQVLLNVIVNSSYAIKERQVNDKEYKGIIKISTFNDEKYVYCSIEDNGVGILQENISKVFEPFFTTKPNGKGTGLGLSISYNIIKNKHMGDIIVESTINVGTKITIKLPIDVEAEQVEN